LSETERSAVTPRPLEITLAPVGKQSATGSNRRRSRTKMSPSAG